MYIYKEISICKSVPSVYQEKKADLYSLKPLINGKDNINLRNNLPLVYCAFLRDPL